MHQMKNKKTRERQRERKRTIFILPKLNHSHKTEDMGCRVIHKKMKGSFLNKFNV